MTTQTITDGVTLSAASWGNDVDSTAYSVLTGVAGTNTITATGPANYAYAAARTPLYFIPAATNTGATTINVSPSGGAALGAKNIFANGAACVGGELRINVPVAIIYDGTQFHIIANSFGISVAAANKSLYGLTYANNGADATNDLDIATGGAMDSTGAYWMALVSALTKQSDVAWAVGSAAGGLDTGAVGDSDYYIWLIARSDTGVVDVLFSLSSTAPTMPTNYAFKRLIGWFKRVAGTVVAFTTYETEGGGLELLWTVPTLDVNLANTLTTSNRTDAVKVPLNFSTIAHLNVVLSDGSSLQRAWIFCPDQTGAAPSQTAAPLGNALSINGNDDAQHQLFIRTSAAGLIGARSTLATVDLYAVSTMGFTWARRN